MKDNKEQEEKLKKELLKYQELEKKLIEADKGLKFPQHPADVLEYLGDMGPLEMDESQINVVREGLKGTIEQRGAREVWKSKLKYKLELYYTFKYYLSGSRGLDE